MRCPKCGTENPAGRVLCLKCGTRLRAGGPVAMHPTSPEASAHLMRWLRADLARLAIVTAVVIAVGAVLGMMLR